MNPLAEKLFYMVEKWKNTFGKCEHVRIFVMDFSKVFNTVNPDLLTTKLYA